MHVQLLREYSHRGWQNTPVYAQNAREHHYLQIDPESSIQVLANSATEDLKKKYLFLWIMT
jgi:hypothetical protein